MFSWVQFCCGLWRYSLKVINNNEVQVCFSPQLEKGEKGYAGNISMFPSHLCSIHLQARSFGGPNELDGKGIANLPTPGCGSELIWLVIGPDHEPAKDGRKKWNPRVTGQ